MKDNIQFALILALFAYIIFLQQCQPSQSAAPPPELRPDTTIILDTILPPPVIVQLPKQSIPTPTIIYVDSSRHRVPPVVVDSSKHLAAQLYQDSLEDDKLTLYYESLVQGQLLDQQLHYKLKVPKTIYKTMEIVKPVPAPTNGLFLTAGIGGKPQQFATVSLGLQFVSKKGWALGYDYDFLQQTHHLRLGVRLLPFKSKH